jgi:hypothetical protein
VVSVYYSVDTVLTDGHFRSIIDIVFYRYLDLNRAVRAVVFGEPEDLLLISCSTVDVDHDRVRYGFHFIVHSIRNNAAIGASNSEETLPKPTWIYGVPFALLIP